MMMAEVLWLFTGGIVSSVCAFGVICLNYAAMRSRYLLWMLASMLAMTGHHVFYVAHLTSPSLVSYLAIQVLLIGMVVLFTRGVDDFLGARSTYPMYAIGLGGIVAASGLVLVGHDRLAFIVANLATCGLLFRVFLRAKILRSKSVHVVAGLVVIAAALISMLAARVVMVLSSGEWSVGAIPQSWAEAGIAAFSIALATAMGPMVMSLSAVHMQVRLKAEAMTDSLTGLWNRRALVDIYETFDFDQVSAVAVFDIDHFKQVNDRHGHDAGDEVLRSFAAIIREQTGTGVHAFRLGGEEFALLLRRTTAREAMVRVEAVRRQFELRPTETGIGPLCCTTSAGLSFGTSDGLSLPSMLKRADIALYKAKESGRNCVVTFGEERDDDAAIRALRQAG